MIHDSAVTTYKNPERAPWALGSLLGNYVLSTDPRLTDARVPLAHTHVVGDVAGLQAALDALNAAIVVAGSSGGGVTDGDKGDITVSASGATWTIDPASVTYAKMQDVSAISSLLGRGAAAGVGAPQEITLGTNLSMAGTTLNAAGGGAASITAVTVTVPYGTIDLLIAIADASVTAVSKILLSIGTYSATSTNDPSDAYFSVEGIAAGTFNVRARSRTRERIGGPFQLNYILG